MDANGQIVMALKSVEVPTKYNTESVEVCADCGGITVAGIYELRNPEDVENPESMYQSSKYDDATRFMFSLLDGDDLNEE